MICKENCDNLQQVSPWDRSENTYCHQCRFQICGDEYTVTLQNVFIKTGVTVKITALRHSMCPVFIDEDIALANVTHELSNLSNKD